MGRQNTILASLAVLAVSVDARFDMQIPRATSSVVLPLDGISPVPTAPPAIHQLMRRDDSSSDATVLVAPDNTCGYVSGRPGAYYTCGGDYTCYFLTSTSSQLGNVACCDTVDCNLRVACVDYDQFYSQSVCDDGCAVDGYTLKCIYSTAPYCNTISFPGGIVDYWCNAVNISVPQLAQTTYSGETDGRSFSPLAITGSLTSSMSINTDISSQAGADVTTDPSATQSSSSSDNSDDSNDDDDGGSSTPIGAIVGGVVGGVAALALIGLAAFFLIRRNKKNKAAQQSPPTDPAYAPMSQPPAGGAGYNNASPQPYYDPKFANNGGLAPQPYPSPDGYYSQHQSVSGAPTSPSQTDPRNSYAPTSPSPSGGTMPGYQPQGGVIHEVPAVTSDNHRGQMHELA